MISDIVECVTSCTKLYHKESGNAVVTQLGTHAPGLGDHPFAGDTTNPELVDCHLVTVGINKEAAKAVASRLWTAITESSLDRQLLNETTYIQIGDALGSREAAFRLFGVGQALGWWQVVTPTAMGIGGVAGDNMAASGYVMLADVHLPSRS